MEEMSTMFEKLKKLKMPKEGFFRCKPDATFGIIWGGNLVYTRTGHADYLLVNLTTPAAMEKIRNSKYTFDQIIPHFFEWDYIIEGYKEEQRFDNYLQKLKDYGIKTIAMPDFSTFYDQPYELNIKNMLINLRLSKQAMDKGFTVMMNFNCIMDIGLPIYKVVFPENIGTIIVDDNHSDGKYLVRENLAMKELVRFAKIEGTVHITGKKNIGYRTRFLKSIGKPEPHRIVPSYWKTIVIFHKNSEKTTSHAK